MTFDDVLDKELEDVVFTNINFKKNKQKLKPLSKNRTYNTQNLKPFYTRTKEEVRELNSRGGKALKGTHNKSIAAKLRWQIYRLQDNALEDKEIRQLLTVMTDANYSHFDIYNRLKKELDNTKIPQVRANLLRLLLEWNKLHHGSSPDTVVNVQNNSVDVRVLGSGEVERLLAFVRNENK